MLPIISLQNSYYSNGTEIAEREVTDYGMYGQSSIPSKDRDIFSSPPHPKPAFSTEV